MRTPSNSRRQRQSAKLPAIDLLPSATLPEGTPGRILVTALRLFAQSGFHGTSVRTLATQCKLQPGALYVHFPSKEHILAELARLGHEAQQAALRGALLEAGDDPAKQLVSVVKSNATLHATYPQLAIVVNEELYALPDELAGPALALRQQSSALLLDILRRGVDAGRFRCHNALVTAAAIGAMGLRVPYWYEPQTGLEIAALAELQAELALRMVDCHHTARRT
jgi:AcrR family transcriptional regulator